MSVRKRLIQVVTIIFVLAHGNWTVADEKMDREAARKTQTDGAYMQQKGKQEEGESFIPLPASVHVTEIHVPILAPIPNDQDDQERSAPSSFAHSRAFSAGSKLEKGAP